jgi:hypothetical protein
VLPFDVEFKARLLELGQRSAKRDPLFAFTCSGGQCSLRVGLALHRVEVDSLVSTGLSEYDGTEVAGSACAGVGVFFFFVCRVRHVDGTKTNLIRSANDIM